MAGRKKQNKKTKMLERASLDVVCGYAGSAELTYLTPHFHFINIFFFYYGKYTVKPPSNGHFGTPI